MSPCLHYHYHVVLILYFDHQNIFCWLKLFVTFFKRFSRDHTLHPHLAVHTVLLGDQSHWVVFWGEGGVLNRWLVSSGTHVNAKIPGLLHRSEMNNVSHHNRRWFKCFG